MYNFPEYSDNYWKTWGSLWQYCKDEPPVDNTGAIIDLMQITLLIHLILKKTDQTVIGNAMTVLQSNTFEKQSKSSSMDLGFSNLWILDLVCKLCYSFYCRSKSRCNIFINWHKTLCSSGNSFNQNNAKLLQHLKSGL